MTRSIQSDWSEWTVTLEDREHVRCQNVTFGDASRFSTALVFFASVGAIDFSNPSQRLAFCDRAAYKADKIRERLQDPGTIFPGIGETERYAPIDVQAASPELRSRTLPFSNRFRAANGGDGLGVLPGNIEWGRNEHPGSDESRPEIPNAFTTSFCFRGH